MSKIVFIVICLSCISGGCVLGFMLNNNNGDGAYDSENFLGYLLPVDNDDRVTITFKNNSMLVRHTVPFFEDTKVREFIIHLDENNHIIGVEPFD